MEIFKKKQLRKFAFPLLLLCVLGFASACGGVSKTKSEVTVGASSFRDDELFSRHIIFKIWSNLGYKTDLIDVPGSYKCCAMLDSGELLTSVVSQGAAYRYNYEKFLYPDESDNDNIRAGIIAGVKYLQAWTLSPEISNYLDFDGKTIYCGNEYGISADYLRGILKTLGVEPGRFMYGSFAKANELLSAGEVDIVFGCLSKDSVQLRQAVEAIGAKLINFTPIQIELILDEVELLQKMVIPANTYKGYAEDIVTLGDYQVYCFSRKLPEDLVYFFLRGYYEHLGSSNTEHDDIHWEDASHSDVENIVIPLHLGAYRYYVEKGAWVPDIAVPPEIQTENIGESDVESEK